jgi:hypothetical protein
MVKPKIRGLANTDDSMWYTLSPEDATLEQLDLIFDLYDFLYDENAPEKYSYAFYTEFRELTYEVDAVEYLAYFIFSKTNAHVILRKTRDWKKFSDLIQEKFEFVK